VASELAVQRFTSLLAAPSPPAASSPPAVSSPNGAGDFDRLRSACVAAHAAILERAAQDTALQGMGTTLAALWFRGRQVALAHVGDSRIYVFRDGKLHPLTFDHSLVNEMIFRGAITTRQARAHPYRHVITRALGVGGAIEPDTARFEVRPGDVYLLCTDGVTGHMDDDDLAQVLLASGSDLDACVRHLIDIANECGGDDNATAVLVELPG
jgi:protein phosphatase